MAYIGNTPGRTTVIQLEARKSFSLGLWFMDQGGRPADLTGCTIRLVAKRLPLNLEDSSDADNLIVNSTAEVEAPETGYCNLDIQAHELDLLPQEYPYVVVLTTATGYSSVVMKGVLDIQQNTEFSSVGSVYTDVQPGQELEVVLRGISSVDVRLGYIPPPGFHWLSAADQDKLDALSTAGNVMPAGGSEMQVIGKASAVDFDYRWITLQAYDGTLDATGIPAGKAPVSDGLDGWNWGDVAPTIPDGDWLATAGQPGYIANKPTLGTAAAADTTAFATAAHQHAASDVTSGVFVAARLPRVSEHLGFSSGVAAPTGGSDGDIYFQLVTP